MLLDPVAALSTRRQWVLLLLKGSGVEDLKRAKVSIDPSECRGASLVCYHLGPWSVAQKTLKAGILFLASAVSSLASDNIRAVEKDIFSVPWQISSFAIFPISDSFS